MLPVLANKDSLTIVILPKTVLQGDIRKRCDETGIKHVVQSDDYTLLYKVRIVFIIVESAVTKAFTDFVNSKVVYY